MMMSDKEYSQLAKYLGWLKYHNDMSMQDISSFLNIERAVLYYWLRNHHETPLPLWIVKRCVMKSQGQFTAHFFRPDLPEEMFRPSGNEATQPSLPEQLPKKPKRPVGRPKKIR